MQVTAFNLRRPAYRGSEGFPSGWRELLRTDHPPEFRAKGGQAACGVQRIAEPHAAVLTKANFLSRDSRGPLFQGLQLREVGGCSAAGSAGDRRLAQLCWLGEQAMLFPFITPPPPRDTINIFTRSSWTLQLLVWTQGCMLLRLQLNSSTPCYLAWP